MHVTYIINTLKCSLVCMQCITIELNCYSRWLIRSSPLVCHNVCAAFVILLIEGPFTDCVNVVELTILLHCVQKKNTHSNFLSYLHELFVDLNKNCTM